MKCIIHGEDAVALVDIAQVFLGAVFDVEEPFGEGVVEEADGAARGDD